MKKKPHKLPCELHDPKLESPLCAQVLDLSDQAMTQPSELLPQPADFQPPSAQC